MSAFFSLPRLYFGTRRPDHIEGGDRSDLIFGLRGDDRIDAGAGNDTILAGDGNDEIEGGDGSDLIVGGRGFDTAIYSGSIYDYDFPRITRWSDTLFTVTGADGDQDILNGVEAIRFAASGNTVYLDGRNNVALAADDEAVTGEDAALTINADDLTANDQDFDGDPLTLAAVSATSAAGGLVSLADGAVSYDPGVIFQYLNEGETAVDSFTYTVDDDKGGTGTATVSVTVTGINDDAVISGDIGGSVTEAGAGSGTPTSTGALIADDVDNDNRFRPASGEASAMAYGSYSLDEDGNWTYTLDNDNAAVDALGAGETLTDSFIVQSTDGTEQEIKVTINGADETAPAAPRINEFHYDNAGTDTGEFVEIRVAAGADVSGLLVELYNGSGSSTYNSAAVSSFSMTSDGKYDYYVWNLPTNRIQNGAPDGIALSENGSVIEFLSYEGALTAANGTAAGMTSTNVGVAEGSSTAAGLSLQRTGDGATDWVGPQDQTPGAANDDGSGGGGELTSYLISEIQGNGSASFLIGEYVLVSAIVTYTVADGFYLQEEDSDADGDSTTSEGVFIHTGGAPGVAVGDKVDVAGTVAEYFDLTEITDVTDIVTISSGNAQPTPAAITLSPDFAANLEQYEGMAITLMSGTDDPLTVIENFDLDRYGEITVSAGTQAQPTQIYDPDAQLAEIQALQQANLNNRLTIGDGSSAQNPDGFSYVPATTGDNGNGYLDAGDSFTESGPTLRLGAEIVGSVEGVLTYDFGEYKMLVDGTLDIDETTNGLARPDEPADVEGRLTVSSFNLLNYFTTLDDGSGAGSGPNNLEPRGATTAEDLARQTDKIVEAMLKIDAGVFGLQELENNGFNDASAIATLVDALNTAAEPGVTYAYANPTEAGSAGFIGTDAITTGLIYKANEVTLIASDFLVYDDGSQQLNRPTIAATFEEVNTGEQFTVAVSHFKSKGGTGTGADADQGDGQGAFNAARTAAAQQLTEWLDPSNPEGYFAQTGITDTDVLVIGDLNAYAQEDPVDAIRDAGYVDLIDSFIGQGDAFSYIFDGQRGTLDQGLASQSLARQVSGATEWHINAQEPDVLSYSSEFNNPAFYNDDVYATSDHDPLLIGLNLGDNVLAA